MSTLPNSLDTLDDFLKSDAFRTWIREKRPADRLYWQQWLVQYPEKRDLYEQAVATLLVLQGNPVNLSNGELAEKKAEIIAHLPAPVTVLRPLWYWGRWAAAATVAGLLISWQSGVFDSKQAIVLSGQADRPAQDAAWQTVKNGTSQPLAVLLPDNSSVLLSTGSQLRFHPRNTYPLREVYLRGEGFFEVTRNPARPFIVYTTNLTTKVLGTSFQIRSFDRETAAYVKVKTGNVSVIPVDSPGKSVVLAKNEQLSFEARTNEVVRQAIVSPLKDAGFIVSQPFTFEFTPVSDVFTQLTASYHIPIRYDESLLRNCTFTGQLNGVPFLEKIRLICLTTASTFEFVDNQVIIHSQGCN